MKEAEQPKQSTKARRISAVKLTRGPLPKVWTNLSVRNPVCVHAEQACLLSRSDHLHWGPIVDGAAFMTRFRF